MTVANEGYNMQQIPFIMVNKTVFHRTSIVIGLQLRIMQTFEEEKEMFFRKGKKKAFYLMY